MIEEQDGVLSKLIKMNWSYDAVMGSIQIRLDDMESILIEFHRLKNDDNKI